MSERLWNVFYVPGGEHAGDTCKMLSAKLLMMDLSCHFYTANEFIPSVKWQVD